MYSIRERSNTAQLFQEEMQDQMLFSRKPFSDSWYSKFFSSDLSDDRIHAFKTAWLKRCAQNGMKSVWLCIDGSNNDCEVSNSELVDVGHAKSHRETNIVSYIWAVDAHTGRPVTWFVNNGSMHDAKAIDEIVRFLAKSAIHVKGVILDRGFVSQDVFDLLEKKSMSYIVMLKSNTKGFMEMMSRHASSIRWKVEHFIKAGIFGTTDHVKIFGSSPKNACTGLYFVGVRNTTKALKLMDKVITTADEIRAQIAKEPEKAGISSEMQKYLTLVLDNDERPVGVAYNFENWQRDLDGLGYHAIVSSEDRSAKDIHELYQLRDVSEKQFSQLKSQLGGAATRVHSDPAIEARFAVAFIAAVLRTEIRLACELLELDTNEMIRKLDSAYLLRMPSGSYEEIHNHSTKCKRLFEHFALTIWHFEKFAQEINEQIVGPVYAQVRKVPVDEPSKIGRPLGSKNKKDS